MGSQTDSSEKYDVTLGNLGARLAISPMENEANVALVEHTLPAHTLAAPLHRHSREDEISHVLEGEMTILADGDLRTVPAGESAVKSRGVWHTFWNAGDEPLRLLEIIAPGELSGYFEEVAKLGAPDPTNEEWIEQFLTICGQYGLEMDLQSIPKLLEEHNLQI